MQRQDHPDNRLGSLTVLSPADISARDPVCGMNVIISTEALRFEHQGKQYYFCCANCQLKFKMVPDQFLTASPLLTNMTAAAGQEYFCPI
jgi:Cu+-exporting ATPase